MNEGRRGESDDGERAARRLARPELQPVVDELARRLGESAAVTPVRLTLRGVPTDTRRALADLLGSDRLPPVDLQVSTDRLSAALDLAEPAALRAVIELMRGPLPDHRAARASARDARDELWAWLSTRAADVDLGTGTDRLGAWVSGLRATGLRGGLASSRARLAIALDMLGALPVDGVSLPSFASDHAGDPHALDHGLALPAIVLDAIACALDQPRAIDAETARTAWESVGVVPDPVSSTVLTLGLSAAGQPEPIEDDGPATPLRTWLDVAARTAEPVVLTLANLRRWPVAPLPATAAIYVVENPSLVVEAASRHWSGPPIVCSSGRPSVAVTTLIRQLTAGRARAFQHADFDPAGVSITQWLAQRARTIPWHMTSEHYLSGVRRSSGSSGTGRESFAFGRIPDTPWDPALQVAMARLGRPVYEEQLRADLLDAMSGSPG